MPKKLFRADTTELRKNINKRKAKFVENKAEILEGIGRILVANIVEVISELGLVDTGRFMDSINFYVEGDSVIVHDGVEYGIYLEFGTGIYGPMKRKITPKNKKALHWEKNGKDFFAKSVKGIKPYSPFLKGLERAKPEINDFVVNYWEKL